uniref:HEAT repeat domain-containing protein n=1 Tax=Alexandrium monilatum TaxID=311494 RepID=A0A7S4SEZ5_9DINO
MLPHIVEVARSLVSSLELADLLALRAAARAPGELGAAALEAALERLCRLASFMPPAADEAPAAVGGPARRRRAMSALGRLAPQGHQAILDVAVEALSGCQHRTVRVEAVRVLAAAGPVDDSAVTTQLAVAANDADRFVRRAAVEALAPRAAGGAGGALSVAMATLELLASDVDPRVRAASAEAAKAAPTAHARIREEATVD